MQRVALLAALALALPAPVAHAQTRPSIWPHAPVVERLPNGLGVIVLPWDSPGVIAYYTLVRVGARDEVEPGHSGFAHLFEHMMFRGTERFPEDVYERTIQGLGADNNAFTSNDCTCYTLTAPSSALERIVEVEADRFQHLRFSETQFRTETGAVRGEYNTWASDPAQPLDEVLSELAFRRHTYGHTTIGYLRDIEAMPDKFEYGQNFFRRFYTPDDATIIVAGDVDPARVIGLVRAQYGAWTGRRDQPAIPVEPEPTAGASRHVPWPGEVPPRMWLGYRIPAFDGGLPAARRATALRDAAALQVIHGLVFDSSSPLYQRLVVDERSLLALSSSAGSFARDPGLFQIDATLAPSDAVTAPADGAPVGAAFAPTLAAIQAELDGIAQGRADATRITAVKSHVRYGVLMGLETPDDAAGLVAQFLTLGGDLAVIEQYLAQLEAVTAADVRRVAQRYLIPTRRFIVTLAHEGAVAHAGGAQ